MSILKPRCQCMPRCSSIQMWPHTQIQMVAICWRERPEFCWRTVLLVVSNGMLLLSLYESELKNHSKIAARKKHISCIVCIVIYCGYVYSISCLSIHHKPHIYHILIYVHIYNIYHIFLYHNIISYHITSNIHIILLSTKNTSYIYIYPTNSPVPVGPGDLPAQHGRSVPDPRCPRENHRQQPWLGCMTPG